MSHDAGTERAAGVETLADNYRLATLGGASLYGGCLVVLVPGILFAIAWFFGSQGVNVDSVFSAALASIPTLFLLWLVIFVWHRTSFYREAVSVAGAPPAAQIPLTVEAAAGVIEGKPDAVLWMRTRSTAGRHGNCRVELYPDGIQIVEPRRGEPRWQFSYANLVHVESVSLLNAGSRRASSRHFVRLIASRPRMAFFLGNAWFVNPSTKVLFEKLREHGVAAYEETFQT